MNYKNFLYWSTLCIVSALSITACDNDDIHPGGASTSDPKSPGGNVVYVTDEKGQDRVGTIDFNTQGTFNLYVSSSKAVEGNVSVTFSYETEILEAYNANNGTEISAFPKDNVTLPDNGSVSLESGSLVSNAYGIKLTTDHTLNPETTYAIPLKVAVTNGHPAAGSDSFIILVRDITDVQGAEKYYGGKPGMKIIGVLEVNDVNPLNVLGFTIQESGKPFFDMVVLFSANINYNALTGKVYVSRNENVQALLDNAEKYIRPLQKRGIKVILGILGNHDISGISTLDDNMCKDFAGEVKNICDAYQLDGVFLDDEYTDYEGASTTTIPGFCRQSAAGASRMAYEIKKAQPQRLVLVYRYSALRTGVKINDEEPGTFVDYVLNDYWDATDPTTKWPGLKLGQAGTGSWNCSDWSQCMPSNSNWTKRFSLTGMRDAGYGALMVFNWTCDPDYRLANSIIRDMQKTANVFWDGELVYDGAWYPKDWDL